MMLCHRVQRAPILEPFNLGLIEGMGKRSIPSLSVLRVDSQSYWFTDRNLRAQEIDPVIGVYFVVVGGFNEGEGKHALFLQIRFVL